MEQEGALRRTTSGLAPTGPLGGLWSTEVIRDEAGVVASFRPIAAVDHLAAVGRVEHEVLPATVLAVATHSGSDATIGQVYAEGGEHVARHETSVEGPIRETYLAGVPGGVTEIGWPVRA